MLAFSLLLIVAASLTGSAKEGPHNCFVRLTNDHVSRTYLYYDNARSADECRAKAAVFAEESNLASMRDEVRVLFYEVEYRDTIIAKVNLKG